MVDLPAPFGPRKPWTSPVATLQVEAVERADGPNVLTRPGDVDGGVVHAISCCQSELSLDFRQECLIY